MSIIKYNPIYRKPDVSRPYITYKRNLLLTNINDDYKYYLFATRYNDEVNDEELYLLLGKDMFDKRSIKMNKTYSGTKRIKLDDNIYDFVLNNSVEFPNVNIEYIESYSSYDVFKIGD